MSSKDRRFYEFGPFRIDPERRLLLRHNQPLSLQPKAFDVLLALVRNCDRVVSKDDLLKMVWPETFVEESNLAQNIFVLRKTLGEVSGENRYIVTVPGKGYRFAERVQLVDDEQDELVVENHSRSRVTMEDSSLASHDQPHVNQAPDPALRPTLVGQPNLLAPSPIRSLAVLALENLSGDAAQEYFAEGLTDELTMRLARISGLKVISRTSAMRYKGTRKSLPEIGRELGVDAIIEGTVERSGERVRLRVQLIEAATDRHLWAESYDRLLTDVLTLESEFAQDVAARLQLDVTRSLKSVGDRPLNSVAFEKYLKGLYFLNQRGQEGFVKAVQSIQQSVEADGGYAPPYAALAKVYLLLGNESGPSGHYLERARSAATTALTLDPTLSEAHTALGVLDLCGYKFADAEREHKLAVSLNPNDAAAHHWYAISYLLITRRFDEALHEIELARALDPMSLMIRSARAVLLSYVGRYGEGQREINEVIEMAPNLVDAYLYRGGILMFLGKSQEAVADFERAQRVEDAPRPMAWLGWGLGVAGERARARAILSDLKALRKEKYFNPWLISVVCLGIDDRDQMFEWLDKAYHDPCLEMFLIGCAPMYEPVRQDPRFRVLLARMGFPPFAAKGAGGDPAARGGESEEALLVARHTRSRLTIEETFWHNLRVSSVAAMIARSPRIWMLSATFLLLLAVGVTRYARRQPPLHEADLILISDFANATGEPIFDGTLKQALTVKMAESPFFNVVLDAQTRKTLGLMERSPDEHVVGPLAREVCQREGAKVFLGGSILRLGDKYALQLDATNCLTGDSMAEERIDAANQDLVLRQLGEVIVPIRRKLGESLSSVQKFDTPIEQATTKSLAALKAYTEGDQKRAHGLDSDSVPFYKMAIELDPEFAIAYARLGAVYNNLEQAGLGDEYLKKAFERRGHISEREKFYVQAHYYEDSTGEIEKAIETYELWAKVYPHDWIPFNNLCNGDIRIGDANAAIAAGQQALRLNPNHGFPYSTLSLAYQWANRYAEAKAVGERAKTSKLDNWTLHRVLYVIALLEGDEKSAQRESDWAKGNPLEGLMIREKAEHSLSLGRVREGRGIYQRARSVALERQPKELAAAFVQDEALALADLGFSSEARTLVDTAHSMLPTASERDVFNALALARAGDSSRAEVLADRGAKARPADFIANNVTLPAVHALVQMNRKNPAGVIAELQRSIPYDFSDSSRGMTAYYRGFAYLQMHSGREAGAEFQKILDHPGVASYLYFPLANLGLARAYALTGDKDKSLTEYRKFLELWKDADPDVPILKEARAEYAKLQ